MFDTKAYDKTSFKEINKKYGHDITYFEYHLNKETAELINGYDGVCVFVNDDLSRPVIEKLIEKKVSIIALRCAGYNNVDLEAAKDKITIVRVPSYSPYAVAEHALALILSLNRKIHRAYYRTRDNNFAINGLMGFDLHGKTAGIIGTGKIGQTLISILKGLGMNIIAYDYYPNKDIAEKLGFTYVSLNELYKKSKIISLHCPLTPKTRHMINKKAIEKMQPGVMIINTGRGHLIDTKALIEGLKKGIIGTAGLDVYEEEENYFFEDHSDNSIKDDTLARLLSFHNVLVTSHQAFFTQEAIKNIGKTTMENFEQFFSGKKVDNKVEYSFLGESG